MSSFPSAFLSYKFFPKSANNKLRTFLMGLLAFLLFGAAVSAESMSMTVADSTSVLTSILVTPASPSIATGTTEQFKATGTFTGGTTRDVTKSVTWTSSKPKVATIGNAAGRQGLATAVVAGTTTITAAHGTIKGTTVLTVNAAAGPLLVSITITPATPSLTIGMQLQFTATGYYSDGSTENLTNTASWSSSSPSVATISTTGIASGIGSGQTTIQAVVGAIDGTTTLTANQVTHVYVVFPPATGVNNAHFMSSVMNQTAIEGVTIPVQWATVEGATPGPGTCSPVGSDTCQQDAFGWTHTYDWTVVDASNAQWFSTQIRYEKSQYHFIWNDWGFDHLCGY